MARKAYQSWYHMLHPHQKVMVLPGLFGWNTSIVSEEVQVRASSFQQVAVPGRALSSLLCAADSGAAGQASWLLGMGQRRRSPDWYGAVAHERQVQRNGCEYGTRGNQLSLIVLAELRAIMKLIDGS